MFDLEKIVAMRELCSKMEGMKEDVILEKPDLASKRIHALREIFGYLDDLAEAIGCEMCIFLEYAVFGFPTNICFNSSNSSRHPKNWYISFDNHYSAEKYSYYIDRDIPDEKIYHVFDDGTEYWGKGCITLVEKWPEVKELIQRGVENEFYRKTSQLQEEASKYLLSYEKASNFEA